MNLAIISCPAVALLRAPNHGFLNISKAAVRIRDRDIHDSAMSAAKTSKKGFRSNNANGLLLYYHQYSFYSQKVVMALHEKRLPFESHYVNILKGEQYQPWFLQINPKGEVPVLQDTGKIIPDSNRIIDYLEDNFSNGDTPRLIPIDKGPEVRRTIINFRNIIDQLPAHVITVGSFVHSDLVGKPKLPFIAPARKALMDKDRGRSNKLREIAEENPEIQDVLLQKASLLDRNYANIIDKKKFLEVLAQVDDVLNKVEDQLSNHTGDKENWWLCLDCFTVADIALTVLLERLNELGLESRFWTQGKRPFIEKYFERVKNRESFKKTVPTFYVHVKILLFSSSPAYIGLGVVTALAVVAGGLFVVKKFLL